jgi:hypothetical protein
MDSRDEPVWLRGRSPCCPPVAGTALDRECAHGILDKLVDVRDRLGHLRHELRRLTEQEGWCHHCNELVPMT